LFDVERSETEIEESFLQCLQANLRGLPGSSSARIQHISSPSHKKRISASEFNKHILELVQHFNVMGNEEDGPKRNTRYIQSDDSVEIISNPVKKVKMDY